MLRPLGLGLSVAAALVVIVARARGRSADQLLSFAVLALAAVLIVVEGVRLLLVRPLPLPASVLSPLALVALGALLVAVTVHLWRSGPHLSGCVLLLAGAATARLARDLLGIAGLAEAGPLAAAEVALSPLSLGLVAAAMLHPRSPALVEPAERVDRPASTRRTAAFGGALCLLPLLWLGLVVHPRPTAAGCGSRGWAWSR
jgi:hypothetical protein